MSRPGLKVSGLSWGELQGVSRSEVYFIPRMPDEQMHACVICKHVQKSVGAYPCV